MNTILSPKTLVTLFKPAILGLFVVALAIPVGTQAATLSNINISEIDTSSAIVTVNVQRDSRSASVWVEYGTTSSLGEKTSSYNIAKGSGIKTLDRNLWSLRPGTLYYVRAVIQNKQGQTITSGTQTFRTLGSATASNTSPTSTSSGNNDSNSSDSSSSSSSGNDWSLWDIFGGSDDEVDTRSNASPKFTGNNSPFTKGYQNDYAPGAKVNGASSGLYLEVVSVNNSTNSNSSLMTLASGDENAIEGTETGDILSWSVIYRNLSGADLNQISIKITIPYDVEIVSVSKTPTRIDGKVLFYDLGAIAPGAQESIDLRTRVKETASVGNTLVFSTIVQYRDSANGTQSVTSYMTTLVKSAGVTKSIKNNLFAAIGDFFTSLWLIVLFLFLSAAYLLYRYRINVKRIEDQVVQAKPNLPVSAPMPRPVTPPIPSPASKPSGPLDDINLPGFKVNGAH